MSQEPFPGLREYLGGRFGPAAREATIEPLGAGGSGIKEGGYGVPYRVRWTTAEGGFRTLVLETVRPGPFGHEDRSDRAALVLRAFDEYGHLPRHVAAVDVGALRPGGPPVGLSGTGELFLLTDFAEGAPYAEDFERIATDGGQTLDVERAETLAGYLAGIHAERAAHPSWYRRR
ncbi:MAG: hypothetical protein ACM3NW_02275, partial [Syntrophomonadaceae bacterium]